MQRFTANLRCGIQPHRQPHEEKAQLPAHRVCCVCSEHELYLSAAETVTRSGLGHARGQLLSPSPSDMPLIIDLLGLGLPPCPSLWSGLWQCRRAALRWHGANQLHREPRSGTPSRHCSGQCDHKGQRVLPRLDAEGNTMSPAVTGTLTA